MLIFLNVAFEVLHITVIIAIVFGWYFRRFRTLHLLIIFLTALSWFGLGMFYGMGYCFLTDYHYQIKRELGIYNLPGSYIKYLADKVFKINSDAFLIDVMTMGGFVVSALLSVCLNIKDRNKK